MFFKDEKLMKELEVAFDKYYKTYELNGNRDRFIFNGKYSDVNILKHKDKEEYDITIKMKKSNKEYEVLNLSPGWGDDLFDCFIEFLLKYCIDLK